MYAKETILYGFIHTLYQYSVKENFYLFLFFLIDNAKVRIFLYISKLIKLKDVNSNVNECVYKKYGNYTLVPLPSQCLKFHKHAIIL